MKIAFVVVWLLSSGRFEGEPWTYFPDLASCTDHSQKSLPPVTREKMRFFSACMDTTLEAGIEFQHLTVSPGEVEPPLENAPLPPIPGLLTMSDERILLSPRQEAAADELYERLRPILGGAHDWAVLASVISNVMAAFAVALRGPDGDVSPQVALEILVATAQHHVKHGTMQ